MEHRIGKRNFTNRQTELMLDFIDAHPDLALGRKRSKECREIAKEQWLECAEILNAAGSPRTGREWAKVWNEYKTRIRAKLAYRNSCVKPDGFSRAPVLCRLEERAINTFMVRPSDRFANNRQEPPAAGSDSMTFYSNKVTEDQSEREKYTPRQLELMLDFLECHQDVALGQKGRTQIDRVDTINIWRECADILNSEGPSRTGREWAKVWIRYKTRMRAKWAHRNACLQRGTTMKPSTFRPLEALEERMINTFIAKEFDPLGNRRQEQLPAKLDSSVSMTFESNKVWNDYKARKRGKLGITEGDGPSEGSLLVPLDERMLNIVTVKVDPLVNNEHEYSVTCESHEENKDRSRRKVTTVRQLKLMLDFLEPHREVAVGQNKSRACRANAVKLWRECAKILNAEGPPRTPRQWVKVWNDYKARMRSKFAHRNAILRRDGPSRAPTLTPLETRMINTYMVKKVNPLANVHELPSKDVRTDSMTFESNKDQTTTLISINEAEFQSTLEVSGATSCPTPSESNEIAYPVPSESYEIAYPVPIESYEIALPVPSESHETAVPVPSEYHAVVSPVPSESHRIASQEPSESHGIASPVPSKYHAIASPVPSESHGIPSPVKSEPYEIASPVPSESHGTASPVPSESYGTASPVSSETHGMASPIKSEPYEIVSPVPSESHGRASPVPSESHGKASSVSSETHRIASLVPSVSGQFPSPSSGPSRVIRVRKRRRRAARSSQQSSKAAEEAKMILLEIENNRTEMDLRNAHTISGALEYLKSIANILDRLTNNMYSQRDHIGATGVGAAGTGVTGTGGTGAGSLGTGGSGTKTTRAGSLRTGVTEAGGSGTGAMET